MNALLICWFICMPLKNLHVNSPFGPRLHPLTGKYTIHPGVDLKARADTAMAMLDGRVSALGYNPTLGIWVQIRHGPLKIIYGHLNRLLVADGDSVLAADPVAITGASGRVTGEHLHLEVRYHDRTIDPIKFLYYLIKKYHEQKLQTTPRTDRK